MSKEGRWKRPFEPTWPRPDHCQACKHKGLSTFHAGRGQWECNDCMRKLNEKAGIPNRSGLLNQDKAYPRK